MRAFVQRNLGYILLPVYAVFYMSVWLWLTGCTTIAAKDFDHGSSSDQQFAKDAAGCEMVGDEHRSVDIALWGAPVSYNRLFDECMRSKGYARKI